VKQNITLSLDKELIQKAKVLSAKRRSSISTMLSQELKKERRFLI
jgi:post-segregation antitoxin (ccd killing protein)